MNYYFLASFLLGVIIDIVDDYVDNEKPLKKHQILANYILQVILIFSIVYLVYIDKKFSDIITLIFILGGLIGFLFAPNIIDSEIWIILILIVIPKFILNITKYIEFIKTMLLRDKKYFMKNYVCFVLPLFLIAIIFSLIEDKIIPEETSYRKIFDRFFQLVMCIIFILYSNLMATYLNIDKNIIYNMLFLVYSWLGFSITSSINQISYVILSSK